MKRTISIICLILLMVLAVYAFMYVNYHPDVPAAGDLSVGNPEMSDVKVSKIFVEALKKVVITVY